VQKKMSREHAKDGGVIPVTGFPRVRGMETSGKTDTVQTKGASHTTQAFVLGRRSRWLYLCSVQRGRFSFVEGSRRSRDDGSGTSRRRSRVVMEVDVHGRRGSSGTRSFFGEVLDDPNVFGVTVVVHGPGDVDRSGSDLRVLPT